MNYAAPNHAEHMMRGTLAAMSPRAFAERSFTLDAAHGGGQRSDAWCRNFHLHQTLPTNAEITLNAVCHGKTRLQTFRSSRGPRYSLLYKVLKRCQPTTHAVDHAW